MQVICHKETSNTTDCDATNDYIAHIYKIINLRGHQNRIIGSKGNTILLKGCILNTGENLKGLRLQAAKQACFHSQRVVKNVFVLLKFYIFWYDEYVTTIFSACSLFLLYFTQATISSRFTRPPLDLGTFFGSEQVPGGYNEHPTVHSLQYKPYFVHRTVNTLKYSPYRKNPTVYTHQYKHYIDPRHQIPNSISFLTMEY